jgi:hypothetical protein
LLGTWLCAGPLGTLRSWNAYEHTPPRGPAKFQTSVYFQPQDLGAWTTQGFHDPGTGSKRLSLVVSDPLCLRFNYSRVTWDLRHSSLTVNQKAREYSLLPSQTTLTRSREGKHQSSLAHVSSSRLSCVNHCSLSSPATKLSVLPSRGQPHGPSCHCGDMVLPA